MNRRTIAVAPTQALAAHSQVFELLADTYPVHFEALGASSLAQYSGAILLDGTSERYPQLLARGIPCLSVVSPAQNPAVRTKGLVNFSKAAALDECFRGQIMTEECLDEFRRVPISEGDEVLCWLDSEPFWVTRSIGQATLSVVGAGLPASSPAPTTYEIFNRRRWLQMLPYFHFLKTLTRDDGWQPPPLRACLMFDDPNLHWRSYGFMDFAKLLHQAKELRYHVCLATVPLDGWFVHRGAAALVRDNARHLSLCIHGNDHLPAEFGSTLPEPALTQSLAQGLRRIELLEKRASVPVARVMVPPHGAFHQEVARPMLELGYEGVCVSRASLTAWNKERLWPRSFGHSVAEFLDGLPVIPRQVLAPGHEGSYRLAAFLNQPIIPHGHHQDCAGGFELLAQAAASISSIGNVKWTDLASISRSNYLTKRQGDQLLIQMRSRRVSVPIEEGVRAVQVERAWMASTGEAEPILCQQAGRSLLSGCHNGQTPSIPLLNAGALELDSPPPRPIDRRLVTLPRFKWVPTARRVLSELRDRLAPMMP